MDRPVVHGPVTQAEVDALRSRACTSKVPFDAPHDARRRARALGMNAYRCNFGDHWHLGHALSMARLEHLARVLRAIANGEVEG